MSLINSFPSPSSYDLNDGWMSMNNNDIEDVHRTQNNENQIMFSRTAAAKLLKRWRPLKFVVLCGGTAKILIDEIDSLPKRQTCEPEKQFTFFFPIKIDRVHSFIAVGLSLSLKYCQYRPVALSLYSAQSPRLFVFTRSRLEDCCSVGRSDSSFFYCF